MNRITLYIRYEGTLKAKPISRTVRLSDYMVISTVLDLAIREFALPSITEYDKRPIVYHFEWGDARLPLRKTFADLDIPTGAEISLVSRDVNECVCDIEERLGELLQHSVSSTVANSVPP